MPSPLSAREFRWSDLIIGEIDRAIKVLGGSAMPGREAPARRGGELVLDEPERRASCRLMRVNHAGEVAAQALYQGQALTARSGPVAEAMRRAGEEELDHLCWCADRLRELDGRTSVLNPLWYVGSFAIGALAGTLGDRTSLGFITETEKQVESHLTDHLERLPAADVQSRAILEQMRLDEVRHGSSAAALGGTPLPSPIRRAMRLTAKIMTRGAYWL